MTLRKLTLISVCCALAAVALHVHFAKPLPARAPVTQASLTPEANRREPVYTYLTIPEWYLVWSPEEYAEHMAERPPSEFPFMGHLRQFWQAYGAVYDATDTEFDFNFDYHLMIMVIGTSTTAEYGLKGGYEHIVGRATEATRLGGPTQEDKLAAEVAREYVDFIKVEPWYKFDFVSPLRRVWTDTDLSGPDMLRKWERKYFLTSEYLAKAGYGWLIARGSESVYDEEKPSTAVLLDRLPTDAAKAQPEVRLLKETPDGSVLALMPRYQAFTPNAQALARAGVNFIEIAGNRAEIVLSAVVPENYDTTGLEVLLSQPILTRPGLRRIYVRVQVGKLAEMLRHNDKPAFSLEHIYDF